MKTLNLTFGRRISFMNTFAFTGRYSCVSKKNRSETDG